jgi:hypothetical protein
MKLYISPKLKELHRNLMSAGNFTQASRVFRFMKTGDKRHLQYVLDQSLMTALKSIGINPLSVSFESTPFQR